MKATQRKEERRGYRITGRVQGVGFRWWTRRMADELDVHGTVKNLSDGAVEIHARAEGEVLDRFEDALSDGPTMARVEGIERIESSGRLPRGGFRIVY